MSNSLGLKVLSFLFLLKVFGEEGRRHIPDKEGSFFNVDGNSTSAPQEKVGVVNKTGLVGNFS